MTPEELGRLKSSLFELIPADGQPAGNTSLRAALRDKSKSQLAQPLTDDDYWLIHSELVSEGKVQVGRGYGGTLRRNLQLAPKTAQVVAADYRLESQLYKPFHDTIRGDWAKQKGIASFVSEVTANKGSKDTGGRWTRPDVVLVAVRTYPFIPGKSLDVMTFEIKPLDNYGIEGVFETASHSAVANRSYLCLHVPKDFDDTRLDRVQRESERFGVGVITFSDPASFSTFNLLLEAERQVPDPAETSRFIGLQINYENQLHLHELIR